EDPYSSFYSKLKAVKDFHRRVPNDRPLDQVEFEALVKAACPTHEQLEVSFSGEEALGKCLDLHFLHEKYVNLISKPFPYLRYLSRFQNFEDINTSVSVDYVQNLLDYLRDFCSRSQPLFDRDSFEENVKKSMNDDPLFCLACN